MPSLSVEMYTKGAERRTYSCKVPKACEMGDSAPKPEIMEGSDHSRFNTHHSLNLALVVLVSVAKLELLHYLDVELVKMIPSCWTCAIKHRHFPVIGVTLHN